MLFGFNVVGEEFYISQRQKDYKVVQNTYLEIYRNQFGNVPRHHGVLSYNFEDSLRNCMARTKLVALYSYAIPTDEAIRFIASQSPIVSIGSGRGYWESLVAQAGGDVICYDSQIIDDGKWIIYSADETTDPVETYHPTRLGDALCTKDHPDRTLFLCWPPYDNPMAFDALHIHRLAGGTKVIYIGEGWGGCTGDDNFHNELNTYYDCEKTIEIPQWYGLHDKLEMYTLKVLGEKI